MTASTGSVPKGNLNEQANQPVLHRYRCILLIFSRIMRIRLTSIMPSLPGRGWVAGLVSVLTGLISIGFLFTNPVWLLGMALAVDLAFQRAMVIAFGVALVRPRQQPLRR